jgi:hypothetical protein
VNGGCNNDDGSNDNKDVICVEQINIKNKHQNSNCNSPKRQEHSMVESEDRFVKFEYKP